MSCPCLTAFCYAIYATFHFCAKRWLSCCGTHIHQHPYLAVYRLAYERMASAPRLRPSLLINLAHYVRFNVMVLLPPRRTQYTTTRFPSWCQASPLSGPALKPLWPPCPAHAMYELLFVGAGPHSLASLLRLLDPVPDAHVDARRRRPTSKQALERRAHKQRCDGTYRAALLVRLAAECLAHLLSCPDFPS